MNNISDNTKRIAKNTFLLYIRMLFLMLINLYTSRVILKILGVEDYGIYNTVGSIVVILSFLNSALSNGSSRFITYELGKKNTSQLNNVFCTILNSHILLAIIVVLIAESIGLWFVKNKLGLPDDRLDAALFAYHFSVLTSIASITQVPYTATIIAHEKMQIYAYTSIIEGISKLLILYLLPILGQDRLQTYAVLLFCVQITIMSIYRIYCIKKIKETKYRFIFDKTKFKEIKRVFGIPSKFTITNDTNWLNKKPIGIANTNAKIPNSIFSIITKWAISFFLMPRSIYVPNSLLLFSNINFVV